MTERLIDIERRAKPRPQHERWQSALTDIAPNKILIRGYPLDEMMGRVGFAEAVYLLLMGELPTPAIGRMLNAVLVSSVDHGVTPPSTLAARNVATSGAPLKDCVASGILAFGPRHGGDIESCMRFLDGGLTMMRAGKSLAEAADAIIDECIAQGDTPPGFGHRFHTRDPRAARLFQMALELELEGEHVRLIRATERSVEARKEKFGRPMPVNVDGAIAAISADLGFAYELGNAIFIISRLPGLIAHAHEERSRQSPMRQIDPKDSDYDGARSGASPRAGSNGVETAADRITREVTSWPGVTSAPHRFGGVEFRVENRELGHLHGSRLADLPFPLTVREELVSSGRATAHHVLPNSGWVSYYMRTPDDAAGAIELFRLNYERPWRHAHQEELIDEASEDSFPASDPPSAGPITGIGHVSTADDK